jgi:Putative peptidoglycan binding domain
MAAPDHERDDDRDDWFADVDGSDQQALDADPASAEDDWLAPAAPIARRRPFPRTRVLVVAGAAVAVLIAGLAAGGVFSSGGTHPHAVTTPPLTTTPATTPATTSKPVPALPAATSKPGDTGAQVKALQRALKALGYSVGAVDGQYGPTTKAAVASFQHDAGLTADGVFGPKTLDALIRKAGP